MLIRFADVEPFAATVEEGSAELLCDGLREVMVGFDYDVLVVPWYVEDTYAGDQSDAKLVSREERLG
jgi:hypothetical protein